MICQRGNKGWLFIRNEQQHGDWRIRNFSNSNDICSPVFHVPTNEKIIKEKSSGMKRALLGMYALNVICVRGMTEQMPGEA